MRAAEPGERTTARDGGGEETESKEVAAEAKEDAKGSEGTVGKDPAGDAEVIDMAARRRSPRSDGGIGVVEWS